MCKDIHVLKKIDKNIEKLIFSANTFVDIDVGGIGNGIFPKDETEDFIVDFGIKKF